MAGDGENPLVTTLPNTTDGRVTVASPDPSPMHASGEAAQPVSSAAIAIAFWVVAGAVFLAYTAGRPIVVARPWTPWAFGGGLLFLISIPFWFERSRDSIKKSAG